jgi:putative MATE family efflux protein
MKDLTKGNIIKLLLAFSIPLLIGNVFQQLYNVIDTKVVGELLGEDALAAIGASSPVFNLIIGALNGMSNGFGIVVSKFYGAKNMEKMRQSVANSVLLSVSVSLVVTIAAVFMIQPVLVVLNTPEEILTQCISYIRVIILFLIFTTAYNLCAAMLRALGDTIRPLIFLAVATVINIGLDLLFVGTLQMGVQGAAYATVIAQAVSFLCCIIYIIRRASFKKGGFSI